MPKRKPRRKRAIHQPVHPKQIPSPSDSTDAPIADDFAKKIDYIAGQAEFISTAPLIFLFVNIWQFMKNPSWVVIVCFFVFSGLVQIHFWVRRRSTKILAMPQGVQRDISFRRISVFRLGVVFFIFVVATLPILKMNGFLDFAIAWIPATLQAHQTLAVVLGAIIGAIFSGIVGNLAYDLLKASFKKVRGDELRTRRNRPR